ncbi:MAG: RNB domain-containing ribonuclease [Pseudomonadota bacterium]
MHDAPLHAPVDADARLRAILDEHGLRQDHPGAVEAEAAALAAAPGIDDPALTDLTELPFVTIDYAHSLDLDQALHIAPEGAGWRLRYALADAAWYVRPGTALMAEALRRGASFYLAHLCAPMLPRALCEGIVSLNPGVDRRALVMDLALDAGGRPVVTRVQRARVRSRAKLAYDGVQAWCDEPGASPLAGQEYTSVLAALRELGGRLLVQARARGMVPFDRPEVAWEPPGPTAPGFRIVTERRCDVERWNEQISLLSNAAGAALLRDHPAPWVQPIFRVHPHPALERVEAFAATVQALVRHHGLDSARWAWRRGQESVADFLARLPAEGREGRVRAAIQRQILHSYERSDYDPEPGPHHALGLPCYGRFTAPMREVVGVFSHRELLEQQGLVPRGDTAADEALRAEVLRAAERAQEVQRTITRAGERLAMDFLLEADLALPEFQRPRRTGTVLGLTGSRLYVRFDEPPIELKVYVDHLQEALGLRYRASDDSLCLEPETGEGPGWRVGDAITLLTAGRDPRRDRWRLVPG